MKLPPSIKTIAPSLTLHGPNSVVLDRHDCAKLLAPLLADVAVDESWYRSQYSDVRDGIERGEFISATQHYQLVGFIEGRLPFEPDVDEEFYRMRYQDVANAINRGLFPHAKAHFIREGYLEGRMSRGDADDSIDTPFNQRFLSAGRSKQR